MLNHKVHFNISPRIWGNFWTWSHLILFALKIPRYRSGTGYNKARHIGPMRDSTFSSPTRTHSELAACPLRITKRKGREVTLDGHWVNGHTYSLRRFLKITLTLLTAQVPSLIAQECGSSSAPKGWEGIWCSPREGAHSEEIQGVRSRGLQFVTTSDKPKCKENWGMLEADSKLDDICTLLGKAVIYVGKLFHITQVWKKLVCPCPSFSNWSVCRFIFYHRSVDDSCSVSIWFIRAHTAEMYIYNLFPKMPLL